MGTPEFMKASSYATARRLANREIRDEATSSEVQWLYDHPVQWLRALLRMHIDIKNQIAKSKTNLNAIAPRDGTNPPQAYLEARSAWLKTRTGRIHVQGIVENKMEEVKALLGSDHFSAQLTVGDLVGIFAEFVEMVDDDDVEHIRAKAQYMIRRLTE